MVVQERNTVLHPFEGMYLCTSTRILVILTLSQSNAVSGWRYDAGRPDLYIEIIRLPRLQWLHHLYVPSYEWIKTGLLKGIPQ